MLTMNVEVGNSSVKLVAKSTQKVLGCWAMFFQKLTFPLEESTSSCSPYDSLLPTFTPCPPTLSSDFLNPLMLLFSKVFPYYFPQR